MSKQTYGSYKDFINGNTLGKIFLFQLVKRNTQPTMVDNGRRPVYFPPLERIKLRDEIIDAKLRKRRVIRYVEGAMSIFEDEQNFEVDADKNEYTCRFENGELIVMGDNTKLLEWLMLSNYNASNINRIAEKKKIYKFIDVGKAFEDQIDKDMKKQEAINFCYNGNWEEVRRYARVLIGNSVLTRDSSEIRWNMKSIAEVNPTRFMEDKNKPLTIRKGYIYQAIDEGFLIERKESNSIYWAENPTTPITTAPVGMDAVEHLANATLTDAGEKIYSAIKDRVAPKKVEATILNDYIPKQDASLRQEPAELDVTDDSIKEIGKVYDKAVERGVIQTKGAWIFFGDVKILGKAAFIKELKTDKSLYEKLKTATY